MTETRIDPTDIRGMAVERLRKKSEFKAHLLAYVVVNASVVAIWAAVGGSFFWPLFPILGWGIGLVFHGWDAYRSPVPTEEQIRREMDALRRARTDVCE